MFEGPRRLDPDVPLRRCQKWTAEAVGRLRKRGGWELVDREGKRRGEEGKVEEKGK